MSEVLIKICGITSEADALLAVGLGADALGFVFAPSPRQVAPAAVGDIVRRLPHEVLTVGVFRDEAPSRVADIANHIGLGAVQLHGHETAEQSREIAAEVAVTIKAFSAGDPAIGRFASVGAAYMLIDGNNPGSGEVFDWRLAEGVADPSRLIVSGGLTSENVGWAIARLGPWGVDVSSGVETAPGRKDPHALRSFITAARRAAAELPQHPAGKTGEDDEASPFDWMEG